VPRRIGDDELAPLAGEIAVGDIDRDALLALRRKAIDQQREVDLLALGAVALAVSFESGELVVEYLLGLVEQSAD